VRLIFYISSHGLGHAARQIEVMRALAARAPDARIVVRTSAARWLFERTAPDGIELEDAEVDTGMAQIDSLRIDERATVEAAARFYADFDRRADAEAARLAGLGADLVVGDIPPLAFAAAARAGVPSMAIGNFTWDWIYAPLDAFARDALHVIPTIAAAYAQADAALRLPLHGGFEPMRAVVRDIPFIARRSTRDRAETRRLLGIPSDRPAAIASFGGYGVDLPLDRIARCGLFTLVDADFATLDAHGLRYQDVVAAVDVVVSKPGYGIVSECVANGAALLYTSRGRFVEYDVFVAGMPRVLRCRFLPQDDLLAGRWADAIDALLTQPPPPERPRVDGADVAARRLLEFRDRGQTR
jgi:L-arabinokinase